MLSRAERALGVQAVEHRPRITPTVPLPLLEWLEAIYPNTCPAATSTLEEFRERATQVALVSKLRVTYEAQQQK